MMLDSIPELRSDEQGRSVGAAEVWRRRWENRWCRRGQRKQWERLCSQMSKVYTFYHSAKSRSGPCQASYIHLALRQVLCWWVPWPASQPRCQSGLNRAQPSRLAQEAAGVQWPHAEALLSPANSASLPLLRQGLCSLLWNSGLEGVNAASIRGLI